MQPLLYDPISCIQVISLASSDDSGDKLNTAKEVNAGFPFVVACYNMHEQLQSNEKAFSAFSFFIK